MGISGFCCSVVCLCGCFISFAYNYETLCSVGVVGACFGSQKVRAYLSFQRHHDYIIVKMQSCYLTELIQTNLIL